MRTVAEITVIVKPKWGVLKWRMYAIAAISCLGFPTAAKKLVRMMRVK